MSDFQEFKDYYEQFMPQVYGFVYSRCGRDQALAEDLVSEVFIKALENFEKFSGDAGAFKAWIFRITRNHLIDHYRSKKNKKAESLDELENVLADESNTEAKVKSDMEAEKLKQALDELPDDKKELVIMKYMSGYSYKEMAEILNEDENKIRVKAFRTVRELKNKLFALKYSP